MIFDAELGPINHIVVGFAGTTIPDDGFELLRTLDGDGRIKILDIEFLAKDDNGAVSWVKAADVGLESFDATATELIDSGDVENVGNAMDPGSVAAIVVWEDRTLAATIDAWTAKAGSILSEGPVAVENVIAALDDDALDEETEGN